MADRLDTYRAKRDFTKTAEPSGAKARRKAGGNRYLIQKHQATRLHYDLRLEHNGVLLSWAVTRGPSLDPHDKRLAVHVEDHPIDYGDFEGTIPKGEYGGGTVMLWDEGTWQPVGDPDEGMERGELKFVLDGERLKGKWVLVRIKNNRDRRSKADNWLLIKERDEYATTEKKPIIERAMTSVTTGRTMEEIAAGNVEWSKGVRFKEADARPKDKKASALKMPKTVSPQLTSVSEAPPKGKGWIHEIKYDGYRAIATVAGGQARVYTRRELDWTDRFAPLVRPLADLPVRSAVLDGEVTVTDKNGHTSFGALQDAMANGGKGITYHLFDLLELDGADLKKRPLLERKEKLREILADQPETGPLFYSDHVIGDGDDVFRQACEMKLEGIISKRADSQYRSERNKNWLKIKCQMGQEFIIIGWRPSPIRTRPFSSLLVGVREEDKIVYRGRVGSGFGDAELDKLWPELEKRRIDRPPADNIPKDIRRDARFVKPELVAELEFRGMTDEGHIRQASYKGLRLDKKPAEVVAETPMRTKAVAKAAKSDPGDVVTIDKDRDVGTITVEGVRVTHPKRVVFPGEKISKKRLIDYYLTVADRILPHIADRPLSLVRFPQGAGGDGFFHKHASPGFPKNFKPIRIKEKSGSDVYLYIEDVGGLVAAVQMGTLELHIWGSHVKSLEKPDRIVFDFDPDEDIDFDAVRKGAFEMRDRMKAIGLVSFAMATGGKGIHVVVPLKPKHGWEEIRLFSEAIARTMSADAPDRYLAEMSRQKRKGKIFIDYLRNGRGATAIAPFSSRAKKGAPVSWPISWASLAKLENAHPATVETAAELLKKQKIDPWKGYFEVDQVLPLEKLSGKAK